MDKIIIKDLEIYAYHGVNPEENFLGQKFIISLNLYLDFREAGKTDDLTKSVSYADICKFVEKLFLKQNYMLIEKCAETTAREVLLNFTLIKKVDVLIKKPWAPIGSHLDYAGVEITRKWHTAYLGLGSNLGDKSKNLNDALNLLKTSETKVTKISTFITTKPVGYLEQDDFLNCAAEIKTLLTQKELITFVLDIEAQLKRERLIHWGPRTLDIDILLYDDIVTTDEDIIIPHPRMTERLFVLEPLSEISPNIIHPLENKRISTLKDILINSL